jgi:phosphatidylglycerol---prolipoprotein diacylglyceryl transferase
MRNAFVLFLIFWWRELQRNPRFQSIRFQSWLPLALLAGSFSIVGAWLFQSLAVGHFQHQGTALYGALGAGIGFIFLMGHWLLGPQQEPGVLLRWLDTAVPGAAIAHGIGRIGCLWAECCYGKEYDLPDGSQYRVPVIELEVFFALFVGIFLRLPWTKRRLLQRPGASLSLYAKSYGVFRIGMEFSRGDPGRGSFFGFSSSQWAGFAVLVLAAIFLDFRERTRDKSPL